jgi:hypothetical protein
VNPRESGDWNTGSVALAVAHPGHELRLASWIARVKPSVFILTAGSRNGAGRARVEASRHLVERLGAAPGALFGNHLDRDTYAWIMAGEAHHFTGLAADLADSFVRQRIRTVVTDSWQLYNVIHDLWHLTVRAAVTLASHRLGWVIDCLDYEVVPASMAARSAGPVSCANHLTPPEVEAKLKLAAEFPEIADDTAELLRAGGEAFLASETLHRLRPLAVLFPREGEKPLYEHYGEQRVADGLYRSVLRWAHVEPIALALQARLQSVAPAT